MNVGDIAVGVAAGVLFAQGISLIARALFAWWRQRDSWVALAAGCVLLFCVGVVVIDYMNQSGLSRMFYDPATGDFVSR